MKTNLAITIATIEQAKKFLSELNENREAYHCDDNAHSITWSMVNAPTFEECEKLNELMQAVNSLPDFDPCGFLNDLNADFLFTDLSGRGVGPIKVTRLTLKDSAEELTDTEEEKMELLDYLETADNGDEFKSRAFKVVRTNY